MSNNAQNDLTLREFNPRPELFAATSEIIGPKFLVIDAHNHLGPQFGGAWSEKPLAELLQVMDACGIHCLVELDGGWGEDILDDRLQRYKAVHPDRFICFGGLDWSAWPERGDRFPRWAAERFKQQVRRGAQGLKIWKNFGLHVKDQHDARVPVDDPRLEPVWETVADLNVPVLIHTADPIAFFRPPDNRNEHYLQLQGRPDWYFGGAEYPEHNQLIDEMAELFLTHPDITFIGAHVANYAEDLSWVSELLEACPRLYIDLGARFEELGRQPYSARDFLIRHKTRVLYGADHPPQIAMYRQTFRFLETRDEYFVGPGGEARPGQSWRMYGVYLPDDVLKAIYHENACRLFGMSVPTIADA